MPLVALLVSYLGMEIRIEFPVRMFLKVGVQKSLQPLPSSFLTSLLTSSHIWPWRMRVSLQKGQVRVAPSFISVTG